MVDDDERVKMGGRWRNAIQGSMIYIYILLLFYYRWRPPRRKCNAKAYKWLDDDDDVVIIGLMLELGSWRLFLVRSKKRKDVMPITSKQLQEMKIIIV